MPYGTIYRISHKEKEDENIITHICDATTFDPGATTTYIDLKGASKPVSISVVDDDSNKFTAIRAKRADINFLSTPTVTARTFADGEDNRWFVDCFVESTEERLFQGWLQTDGHHQAFLPAGTYTVQLIANDGLGTLKGVSLTKTDGTNPRGRFKIIQFIAWALQKTGLQLDIIVANSLVEEDSQTSSFYEKLYLNAKTFEKDINVSVDCYRALEIIFGYDSQLFQHNGKWWIGRVSEMTGNLTYGWQFDYTGALIGELTPTEYSQSIGKSEAIKWTMKDCLVSFTRPNKYVQLNYPYEYPKEIINNIDFSRGTFSGIISLGNPLWAAYTMADWEMKANVGAITSSFYIVRKFKDINHTYEDERYMRFTSASTFGDYTNYARAIEPIPVHEKDKATISVDWRYESDMNLHGDTWRQIFALFFFGVDNRWYAYREDLQVWYGPFLSLTGLEHATTYHWIGDGFDERTWQTASYELPPFPKDGDLYVGLRNAATVTHLGQFINYKNLRFDYMPYINGDYSKYNGQYNKVSQTGEFKIGLEDEVNLSDSPKKLFKGAMFKQPSPGIFVPAERFVVSGDLRNQGFSAPYDDEFFHPYGFIQAFAVWNQIRRRFINLSGSLLGMRLTEGDEVPDLHRNYDVTVSTSVPEVEGKSFVLVGYDQDPRSGEWKGTLVETWDDVEGNVFDDPFEFRYIDDY